MNVRIYQYQKRWWWNLDNRPGTLNFGATHSFRFKYFCRRDFKKRYLALRLKRPDWPTYDEVTVS